jgi:hypothetical protein
MTEHQADMIIHWLERVAFILASIEEKVDKGLTP